jgi:hypothetical protein
MTARRALRSGLTALLVAVIASAFLPACLAAGGPPAPSLTPASSWYFAEGTTAYGFEEYVCVQNPSAEGATIQATCMLSGDKGQVVGTPFRLASFSRATINVAAMAPSSDVSVRVDSDVPQVVCERSMYWANRVEGHDSIGVTSPMTKWYLAEGCTNYGFDEYLAIQNPGTSASTVTVTYNTSKGPVAKAPFSISARSRKTIHVNEDVAPDDVSVFVSATKPVVAERSMYWDGRRGGHDSIGTASPGQQWFLAEGSTKWGFSTYVLVQNPSSSTATVNMTFLTTGGPVKGPTLTVKAGSRQTVDAGTVVGAADFSTNVTANRGIICERSMYWNNGTGKAGHDTIGAKQSDDTWYLAEGTTAYGFETFVLIANPNGQPADVSITYMTPNGNEPRLPVTVPPYARITINVNEDLASSDVSVKLEGSLNIVAERAMYWHARGGGHDSIGYAQP